MKIEAIGFVASIITAITLIPQVLKVYKEKSIKGLSLITIILQFAGALSWLIYAYYINSPSLFITSIFIMVSSALLILARNLFKSIY